VNEASNILALEPQSIGPQLRDLLKAQDLVPKWFIEMEEKSEDNNGKPRNTEQRTL